MIFVEGDWKALAGCLQRLKQKPAFCRSLGRKARERSLKFYDERKLADKLGDFLESLADAKN
jgi:hypothetical protein